MTDQETILVVDDETKICQFLEILLRREGYRVNSAYNVADALIMVERSRPDLIITDLKMPGMDGFELVRRLKEIDGEVPIVMITGYATVENAVKAMRYGVDDYVTKPFNIDELRKVIARALRAARLERENRELVIRLRKANNDLERHKELLVEKIQKTGSELRAVRNVAEEQKDKLYVFDRLSRLVTAERNLNRLLRQTLLAINAAVDARSSSIMLCEGEFLVVRACEGMHDTDIIGKRQRTSDGIAGYVVRQQQALIVQNLQTDDRVSPTPGQEHKQPSFISVPIIHRGFTLGVINVGNKRNNSPFGENDLAMVSSVSNQIAPAIENAALYHQLEESCVAVLKALMTTIEAKDYYTSGHSQRVRDYACDLARAVGMRETDLELLRRAAELHDIGKIAVNDTILDKPERLTQNERDLVQAHPSIGERIVEPLDFLKPVRSLIRHHHERVDGKGYPDGLHAEEIPILARVLAIADAFDAMTSERPYRPAMNDETAMAEIRSGAGQQFDEDLARVFLEEVVNHQTDSAEEE